MSNIFRRKCVCWPGARRRSPWPVSTGPVGVGDAGSAVRRAVDGWLRRRLHSASKLRRARTTPVKSSVRRRPMPVRRRSTINRIRLTMGMDVAGAWTSPRSDALVAAALQRRCDGVPSRSSHVDFTSCCLGVYPCERTPRYLSVVTRQQFFSRNSSSAYAVDPLVLMPLSCTVS